LRTLTPEAICEHFDHNQDINKVDLIHFWSCVLNCRNSGGKQPFKELALVVIGLFTLPVSNAVVERIFSFMNAMKTKERNRMQLETLEALLRLRVHMKGSSKISAN